MFTVFSVFFPLFCSYIYTHQITSQPARITPPSQEPDSDDGGGISTTTVALTVGLTLAVLLIIRAIGSVLCFGGVWYYKRRRNMVEVS